MVYRWREGARYKGKAQDVGERLEAIREENGGTITPAQVVEDSRDETSPLHPNFEWDDAKAATTYREDQARSIIGAVMVVYSDVENAPKEPVRAFASINTTDDSPAYTSTLDAMRSPAMRSHVLAQAKKELDGWRRRYRHYQELAGAVAQVEVALGAIDVAA